MKLCDPYQQAVLQLREQNTLKDSEILRLSGDVAAASAEVLRLRQEVLKLAADHDLKIRSDVEKIGRLKAQVDQLQKSNDYHTIEALRLTTESLELRSHKVHPDGVPGKL